MSDRSSHTDLPPPADSSSHDVVLYVRTTSPEQTRALAAEVADKLVVGDVIVLSGDLGAGKTCFTQGLAVGLGIDDRVTSPTFTLANTYEGRLVLNHLDVYRLDGLDEVLDLDLPELLEDGVTVIEWGEKVEPALGGEYLVIRLLHIDTGLDAADELFEAEDTEDDDRRRIEFVAVGERWAERLTDWADVTDSGSWLEEWSC